MGSDQPSQATSIKVRLARTAEARAVDRGPSTVQCKQPLQTGGRYTQRAPGFHTAHRSFSEQVPAFVALERSPRQLKRKEAQLWFDESGDEAMDCSTRWLLGRSSHAAETASAALRALRAVGYDAFVSSVITRGGTV